MENEQNELKIRKVNGCQFDVILKETNNVTVKHGLTYAEVSAFLWSLYGRMMCNCDVGKSVCSMISVKF